MTVQPNPLNSRTDSGYFFGIFGNKNAVFNRILQGDAPGGCTALPAGACASPWAECFPCESAVNSYWGRASRAWDSGTVTPISTKASAAALSFRAFVVFIDAFLCSSIHQLDWNQGTAGRLQCGPRLLHLYCVVLASASYQLVHGLCRLMATESECGEFSVYSFG